MTTTRWLAEAAWLGGPDLAPGVVIEVRDGQFADVSNERRPGDIPLAGIVLPGLVNSHSHAFHRLLRGRTHELGGDFWVWRESMYDIAATLTPETYEEVATAVYTEMAMAGITSVGEFHYLHHQAGSTRYEDPNEMGHALIRAARRAGIRIALLDAGYFTAGFGDAELDPVQKRFSDGTLDRWLERAGALAEAYRDDEHVTVGLAPHSVRAVPPEALSRLGGDRPSGVPLHIHASEQRAENEECLVATGKTPVGLLSEAGLLSPDTTLVHATHVGTDDISAIATAGSGVCYCTTTERDLADGVGPAADLAAAGVSLSLGTDSHAHIDMFEEATGMEMHQRLATGRRGVIAPLALALAATANGSRALGFPETRIATGRPADFIVVNRESVRSSVTPTDGTIAQLLFSANAADVTDVFVAGERIVSGGSHTVWDRARLALTQDQQRPGHL